MDPKTVKVLTFSNITDHYLYGLGHRLIGSTSIGEGTKELINTVLGMLGGDEAFSSGVRSECPELLQAVIIEAYREVETGQQKEVPKNGLEKLSSLLTKALTGSVTRYERSGLSFYGGLMCEVVVAKKSKLVSQQMGEKA